VNIELDELKNNHSVTEIVGVDESVSE